MIIECSERLYGAVVSEDGAAYYHRGATVM